MTRGKVTCLLLLPSLPLFAQTRKPACVVNEIGFFNLISGPILEVSIFVRLTVRVIDLWLIEIPTHWNCVRLASCVSRNLLPFTRTMPQNGFGLWPNPHVNHKWIYLILLGIAIQGSLVQGRCNAKR